MRDSITNRVSKSLQQSGVTLVELMVAITLGLILMTGMVQILLSSKKTYAGVIGQSQLMDSGRLSLHFLSYSLRMSGYWGDVTFVRNFGSDIGLVAASYVGRFASDEYVSGTNNDNSDANVIDGSDQIWVRYNGAADGRVVNCAGTTISGAEIVIEHFYIKPATGTELIPSLYCATTVMNINQDSGVITVSAGSATNRQPLINGIENMQILYGQAQGSLTRFVNAAAVTDWKSVRSVRIALLVSSLGNVAVARRASAFTLLDETIDMPASSRLLRVFEQRVSLRNSNW